MKKIFEKKCILLFLTQIQSDSNMVPGEVVKNAGHWVAILMWVLLPSELLTSE